MNFSNLFQLIVILGALAGVSAEAAIMKMATGELNFTAIGSPGILKIRGEAKGTPPKGQIELKNGEANGEFTFPLAALDTGIELRDRHMKDKYLEVGKYPDAKLKIVGLKVSEVDLKSGVSKDFTGELTLHGETKAVTGKFELDKTGKSLKAQFPITVSDFNIGVPKYMGITISEQVDIEIESQLETVN